MKSITIYTLLFLALATQSCKKETTSTNNNNNNQAACATNNTCSITVTDTHSAEYGITFSGGTVGVLFNNSNTYTVGTNGGNVSITATQSSGIPAGGSPQVYNTTIPVTACGQYNWSF